jgi:uncharacterized protein
MQLRNVRINCCKPLIRDAIEKYQVDIITIGNGTASRETEEVVAELLQESRIDTEYIIVSEAGASVYSASKLAGEEFPDFDLSLRSAVSIARRLQDPLAELVKIEPKAVGVGQYQHDVQPKHLDESLQGVVESAVNTVGVDLNTASPSLLQNVAGLKPTIAKNIVAWREENGKFSKRAQLKKIPRLGEQTFIQCAGFIRIPGGENPLENTPVHPESYALAENILHKAGFALADLENRSAEMRQVMANLKPEDLAEEFKAGLPTVKDILDSLQRPGRDPREDLPRPKLRRDVTHLEDLSEGMILEGTVRNIVDFGAFVDIGVKHDGLVHISQISQKFIKHPMWLHRPGLDHERQEHRSRHRPGRPRPARLLGAMDRAGGGADVGAEGFARERAALRLRQARRRPGRPVVLHRHRRGHRPHGLAPAHRHGTTVEQPLRRDLSRARRVRLCRHPRRRAAPAGRKLR